MTVAAKAKGALRALLPRGANVGRPVVQAFLNDHRQTRFTLHDFAGLLSPATARGCRWKIDLYGPEGTRAASRMFETPPYGTTEVVVPDSFDGALPAFGMLSARFVPPAFFSWSDRHLGRVRPQIFALYRDRTTAGLMLVHSQTGFDAPPAPETVWSSNLEIETASVNAIEMLQINPGAAAVESEARLLSGGGAVLDRRIGTVPPRGARRELFELAALRSEQAVVRVGLRGLAAANGKPLLFLHLADGTFTGCHG